MFLSWVAKTISEVTLASRNIVLWDVKICYMSCNTDDILDYNIILLVHNDSEGNWFHFNINTKQSDELRWTHINIARIVSLFLIGTIFKERWWLDGCVSIP